jgi:catechol 2,3-dioxygenase-like lactoylglutathione lyase family enzyme
MSGSTSELRQYVGMEFTDPQVILFVADCERAATFYQRFGFQETFRTTADSPVKVELALGGFGLGLALPEPAADSHGISPITSGHRACITLWTDDVNGAYAMALRAGATDHAAPHPFLAGRLRVAFVEDLDGHPVQLVQRIA